jgi:hypothetical protein
VIFWAVAVLAVALYAAIEYRNYKAFQRKRRDSGAAEEQEG